MAETRVTFDSEYQFCWVKNTGSGDCYISDRPNIQAEAEGVAYLPAGEATLITMTGRDLYIVGDTVVECKAQNFAECPYDGGGSGGGEEPVLITKSISTNGTYDASDDDADGYSSVIVNVAQDVELMTRQQWDTLTTAQKQAKGLVGIQDAQSGFERGILVYGASYVPINNFLPYSTENTVVCSAKAADYVSYSLTWGLGTMPVQMSATDATYNSEYDAVYIPAATSGSNTYAYLTQPESEDDSETVFTVYMVLKNHSTASGARLFVTGGYNSNWDLILTRQSDGNAYFGSWGTDTDTGVSADNFFVCAIKWDGTLSSDKGVCIIYDAANDTMVKMVASPAELSSTSITFGTNLGSYRQNGDISAKFIGMVNVFETDTVMENNIRNLYNQFIAE